MTLLLEFFSVLLLQWPSRYAQCLPMSCSIRLQRLSTLPDRRRRFRFFSLFSFFLFFFVTFHNLSFRSVSPFLTPFTTNNQPQLMFAMHFALNTTSALQFRTFSFFCSFFCLLFFHRDSLTTHFKCSFIPFTSIFDLNCCLARFPFKTIIALQIGENCFCFFLDCRKYDLCSQDCPSPCGSCRSL